MQRIDPKPSTLLNLPLNSRSDEQRGKKKANFVHQSSKIIKSITRSRHKSNNVHHIIPRSIKLINLNLNHPPTRCEMQRFGCYHKIRSQESSQLGEFWIILSLLILSILWRVSFVDVGGRYRSRADPKKWTEKEANTDIPGSNQPKWNDESQQHTSTVSNEPSIGYHLRDIKSRHLSTLFLITRRARELLFCFNMQIQTLLQFCWLPREREIIYINIYKRFFLFKPPRKNVTRS